MSESSGGDLSTRDLADAGRRGGAERGTSGGGHAADQATPAPSHPQGAQEYGAPPGEGFQQTPEAVGQPEAQPQQSEPQTERQESPGQESPGQGSPGQESQAQQSRPPEAAGPAGNAAHSDAGGLVQDTQGFRERWAGIQAAFVDEPRQAVEQADGLVAEVIQHLATSFAEERSSLERQWAGGHPVSTEDLRVSLQRYRQFFQALLRD